MAGRNRNILGLIDVVDMGVGTTSGAVDLETVTGGAGGVTLNVFINNGAFAAGDDIFVEESSDNSTWSAARDVDCSWKFAGGNGVSQDPGEYDSYNDTIGLDDIYGTPSRSGDAARCIVSVAYNGLARYARIRTTGLTAAEILGTFALVRREYRTDAESLPA